MAENMDDQNKYITEIRPMQNMKLNYCQYHQISLNWNMKDFCLFISKEQNYQNEKS